MNLDPKRQPGPTEEEQIGIFTALHPWVMWTLVAIGALIAAWGGYIATRP
ncbi:MAG: hypothetical protein ACHQC8_07700 [Solirubrobacterales bacterium]